MGHANATSSTPIPTAWQADTRPGGQLAGMLAATAWSERGLPDDLVKSVFGFSGLYDLEPVRR